MPWKRSDVIDVIIIALIVFLCWAWVATLCNGQTVTRVIDGDTIVLDDGRHIRLLGVDAPELKQPGGDRAKRWLEVYCLDRAVTLEHVSAAAWGRTQAVVRWRRWDLGESMIAAGLGWTSEAYLKKHSDLLTKYRQRQTAAKAARKGVWVADNPIAPWDWRDGLRSVTIAPAPPPKAAAPGWTWAPGSVCVGST